MIRFSIYKESTLIKKVDTREEVKGFLDLHGDDYHATDDSGEKILFSCVNCGAGDVSEWQDCPECGSCNV